eukprot:TRINITY_DN25478_c0_g1_i1.p1 TRINITY_DN25478_c0_g1~~TRINITY_DN25478_c0_g1_i1.p1  ORF type:complete len:669 (+),score=82.93 TRINITY_DN25478_c0_g1_i1:61-2067(+)
MVVLSKAAFFHAPVKASTKVSALHEFSTTQGGVASCDTMVVRKQVSKQPHQGLLVSSLSQGGVRAPLCTALAFACISKLARRSKRGHPQRLTRSRVARSVLADSEVSPAARTRRGSENLENFLKSLESPGLGAPGKGGNPTIAGLRRANDLWCSIKEKALCHKEGIPVVPAPEIVRRIPGAMADDPENKDRCEFDVVVCGGTLGLLLASALQHSGLKVCVMDRGAIRGRVQDWNVNPEELEPLIAEGVLSEEAAQEAITSEWATSRIKVDGVDFQAPALNAGVCPATLLASARTRFEAAGGTTIDYAEIGSIDVFDDGAVVHAPKGHRLSAQLVLDAMGTESSIVKQARGNAPPDAACLCVGTMASGYPQENNKTGDYLRACPTRSPRGHQAFWEAFPAGTGGEANGDRSTYYFAYMLPGEEDLPDLFDMFEEYLEQLPEYQGVHPEHLQLRRALFSSFVAYRQSPLESTFDRVVQVGDAAGLQSPLSFGGFGAMCRHLRRLRAAFTDAIRANIWSKEDLALVNPYFPNLSMQWTMYRSIAKPPSAEPDFVRRMMGGILGGAASCGPGVSQPILQDVFSLSAMVPAIAAWLTKDPAIIPKFVSSMGIKNVFAAVQHLAALAVYTALNSVVRPVIQPMIDSQPAHSTDRFRWRRRFEAWEYGSGLDFNH